MTGYDSLRRVTVSVCSQMHVGLCVLVNTLLLSAEPDRVYACRAALTLGNPVPP